MDKVDDLRRRDRFGMTELQERLKDVIDHFEGKLAQLAFFHDSTPYEQNGTSGEGSHQPIGLRFSSYSARSFRRWRGAD